MKLTGPFVGRRIPAVGKAFYVQERRGVMVAAKWPRKRGRPLHPTTIEQNEKFKQANKMAQFAPAAIQMAHRKMSEGTNLLPRDLMISAMYGRGFHFIVANQRSRYPMAARQDLSATLDILGALAGDMLGRGPELWERIRPSAPGQSLISGLAGELPTFQTIGSQDGLWVQIADDTLAVALGINVAHVVIVPVPFKELEFTFSTTTGGQNLKPVVRINNLPADAHITQLNSTVNGGATNTYSVSSNKYIDLYDPAGMPDTRIYYATARITLIAWTPQYAFIGNAYNSKSEMVQFQGRWVSNTAVPFATLEFLSVAGAGLGIGTRIQVRGIFP